MPDYIVFDPSSTPVPNRVRRHLQSFDQGREGELGPNFLRDPDVTGINLGRAVVDNGTVRDMTAQERQTEDDAQAAEELAQRRQAIKDRIRDARNEQRVFTIAVAKILKQYVDYRADGNPALTLSQLNTQLRNEIDSQADSLS